MPKKEIMSFSRSVIFQCILLFTGICAGLWINEYCFILVAGITITVSVFGELKSIYYHLFFCLPFTMIYKLSPSSTSLFVYAMLVAGLVLMIRIRSFGMVQFFLIILFGIYAFIGMGDNITTVIKMIIGMILFYIFVKKIDPLDFKNQTMAFALGLISSSCIGLLKGSWSHLDMYYSDMNTIYIDGVVSFRFTGLYLDPNYYSISAIFALTLCLMLFFKKEGNRVLLGTMIVALSIFGFLSYSKMFLFSILAVSLIFVFWGLKSPRKIIISLFVFLFGGGILYKWMQNGNYLSVMIDRLFKGDISTGRFDIWEHYIEYIKNSPMTLFFGDGLGAQYHSVGGPHNTYIETIFFIGLVGGTLFLIVIFSIFRCRKIIIKRNILNYTLPFIFSIMVATLGCLTINDLLFYFMLIWIGLNFDLNVSNYKCI